MQTNLMFLIFYVQDSVMFFFLMYKLNNNINGNTQKTYQIINFLLISINKCKVTKKGSYNFLIPESILSTTHLVELKL